MSAIIFQVRPLTAAELHNLLGQVPGFSHVTVDGKPVLRVVLVREGTCTPPQVVLRTELAEFAAP